MSQPAIARGARGPVFFCPSNGVWAFRLNTAGKATVKSVPRRVARSREQRAEAALWADGYLRACMDREQHVSSVE